MDISLSLFDDPPAVASTRTRPAAPVAKTPTRPHCPSPVRGLAV